MKGKSRIETNAPQAGLNAAFARLSLENLPEGPEEKPAPVAVAKAGRVVLRHETAHRKGKSVIVVGDFAVQHGEAALDELARALRAACGCGGTRREREIELQGDDVAKVRALLEARGFQVAGVR